MMCGIHRVEKRGRQAVGGLQAEANRDAGHKKNFNGSDIDWSRTQENVRLISSDNWLKDINKTIADAGVEHVRKDAIVMLDGLYTASPEFFKGISYEEQIKYFKDCLQFHIDTYCHGDTSLVKNAVIHYDETTPHMQVCSVPITEDGRLSAKDVMGNKAQYHRRQDAFYEQVTKEYNLERGDVQEHGRNRKHRDQMEYKAEQAELKAKEVLAELPKVEQEIKSAQEDLGKTLELKEKAARVKIPFRDKNLITYHKNALESIKAIGREAQKHMEEARIETRSIAGREEAVKAKEQEIEPLHQKARQIMEKADGYLKNVEDLIVETARDVVKEAVQAVEPALSEREKRMEQFMDSFGYDGQTLLQEFNKREKEYHENLEEEIMEEVECTVRGQDWDVNSDR